MFNYPCSLLSLGLNRVTFCLNSDISNPLSLTNLICPKSGFIFIFFHFSYSVGDHGVTALLIHCIHQSTTDRNVISMCYAMQSITAITSRAGFHCFDCWKKKEEHAKPTRWLTKRKVISLSTASLRQENKWSYRLSQVTSNLEAPVLHGKHKSDLYSRGNSKVICQNLKSTTCRNN